jgi:hypothetical protein
MEGSALDINDYVFGGGVISPEQQKALADNLRSRDNMGAIMALTGDRAAAPVGQQFMQSAGVQRQQGVNHNYYQGMLRQSAADLEERKRANNLNYQANMARTAAASARQGGEKRMDNNTREMLKEALELYSGFQDVKARFDPKFLSNVPLVGGLRRTMARKMPGLTAAVDPSALEFQAWMSDLDRIVESPLRHQLFGSALTAPELKKWKELTVDPDASPQQVLAWFERNMPRAEKALQGYLDIAAYNYPEQTMLMQRALSNPDPGQGGNPTQVQVPGAPQPVQDDDPLYEIIQ